MFGEKEGCGAQTGSAERGGHRPCAPSRVTRPGRGAAAAVPQRGLAGPRPETRRQRAGPDSGAGTMSGSGQLQSQGDHASEQSVLLIKNDKKPFSPQYYPPPVGVRGAARRPDSSRRLPSGLRGTSPAKPPAPLPPFKNLPGVSAEGAVAWPAEKCKSNERAARRRLLRGRPHPAGERGSPGSLLRRPPSRTCTASALRGPCRSPGVQTRRGEELRCSGLWAAPPRGRGLQSGGAQPGGTLMGGCLRDVLCGGWLCRIFINRGKCLHPTPKGSHTINRQFRRSPATRPCLCRTGEVPRADAALWLLEPVDLGAQTRRPLCFDLGWAGAAEPGAGTEPHWSQFWRQRLLPQGPRRAEVRRAAPNFGAPVRVMSPGWGSGG